MDTWGKEGTGKRPALLAWAIAVVLAMALVASCSAQPALLPVDEAPPTQPPPPAACVPAIHGDLAATDPTGQVVIFWHPYRGSREALVLDMVDEFNRTNGARVTVLAESQGDSAQLHRSVADGVPAGRVPDLTTSQPGEIASYAAVGVLAPLECYAADPRWGYDQAAREDFFQFSLAAGFVPQLRARYGWPFHTSAEVVYYNEAWLAELGFDGPPATWEEFDSMACAAAAQPFSDSRGEGTVAGYEYAIDSRHFTAFVLSRGGAIADDANSAYTFGGQEGLDTLAFLKDLTDRGCATVAIVPGDDRDDFSAGSVLFAVAPVHHIPLYQKAVEEGAGFRWNIAAPPHPADREATTMQIYGPSFTIFWSNPERQLAAWTFVRWMNEPEQQARWATSTSYYPTRRAATDLMADYRLDNPWYEMALGLAGADYAFEPAMTAYDVCREAIEQMLTAVLAGGDAQTALDAANGKCAESLQPAQ